MYRARPAPFASIFIHFITDASTRRSPLLAMAYSPRGQDRLEASSPLLAHPHETMDNQDEYYLVRIHRHAAAEHWWGRGFQSESVRYYKLGTRATEKDGLGQNDTCASSTTLSSTSFLSHYNRVNNVMFGQLDPFYYPALRRRAEERERASGEAFEAELSRQPLWEPLGSNPLRTMTPIALMERMAAVDGEKTSMAHGKEYNETRNTRDSERRPSYLLLTTAGLLGAAAIFRSLKMRRRLRFARADARAWQKMAMRLVERPVTDQPVAQQVPLQPRPATLPQEGNAASKGSNPAVVTASSSLSARKEAFPRATSTTSTPRAQYAAVHPHEDWDWTPADHPPAHRALRRRHQRLPPWCVGFSSGLQKPRQKSQDVAGVSQVCGSAPQGNDKDATTATASQEDEDFIVDVLRDVYGIDTHPRARSIASKTETQIPNNIPRRNDTSSDAQPLRSSRISKAVKAHQDGHEACGEAQVLSGVASLRDFSPDESTAYDHEELVREVLEDEGRSRRQRLRSRLAARLLPARHRLRRQQQQDEAMKAAVAKESTPQNKATSDNESDIVARLCGAHYYGFGEHGAIIDAISAQFVVDEHMIRDAEKESTVKGNAKAPAPAPAKESRAAGGAISNEADKERMRDLERQVWALMARIESMERWR